MAQYGMYMQNYATGYSALLDRYALAVSPYFSAGSSPLKARSGLVPAGVAPLQVTAGGGMSVNVSIGQCVVQGTTAATQGAYLCTNDAVQNLTFTAPVSNSRIDIIQMKVIDDLYNAGTVGASLTVKQGVASGSPVAPAADADSYIIAQVQLASSTVTITSGLITYRAGYTVTKGGIIPCASSTEEPASADCYKGLLICRTDTMTYKYWNGTAWIALNNEPYVRVRKLAASLPASTGVATFVQMQWSQTDRETDASMWDIGQNTRLVAPIPGEYQLVWSIGFITGTTVCRTTATKNGVTTTRWRGNTVVNSNGADHSNGCHELVMAANDYIEIQIWAAASTQIDSYDNQTTPYASLKWLRP